jgi:hypothetical protein
MFMKKLVFIVAIIFALFGINHAQKLTQEEMPPGLLYEFQNRYPGVKQSEWEKTENQYVGMFQFMGNSVISYYDISTTWLFSETIMTMAQLPRITQRHIVNSFPKYDIKKIVLIELRREENYYKIETVHQNNIFYLIYDKVGVFTKITDKEGNTIVLETNLSFEGQKEVSVKELPSPIVSYISANFSEFSVNKSYFINNQEYENVYYISLSKQSDKREVILFFNFRGELLSQENPFLTNETKQTQTSDRNKRTTVDITVDESEIPQKIKDDFSKKVRNAQKTTWNKTDKTYYVSYIDPAKMQRNVIEYDLDGEWVKTSTELRQNEINQNIVKYIKENYADLRIYSAANVVAAPRERYVFVKIFNPKWINDPMVYHEMNFSTSGRLEKIELAEYIEGDGTNPRIKQRQQDDSFLNMIKQDNISLDIEYKSISIRELPSRITSHINEKYPSFVIHECYLIPNDITEVLEYVITIKLEGFRTQKKLIYDFKGRFIEENDL